MGARRCGDTPQRGGPRPRPPAPLAVRTPTYLPLAGQCCCYCRRPPRLPTTSATVVTPTATPPLVRRALLLIQLPFPPPYPQPAARLSPACNHDGFCVVLCGRHPPGALCARRPRRDGGARRPRGALVHGAVQGDAVYGGAAGAGRVPRGRYVSFLCGSARVAVGERVGGCRPRFLVDFGNGQVAGCRRSGLIGELGCVSLQRCDLTLSSALPHMFGFVVWTRLLRLLAPSCFSLRPQTLALTRWASPTSLTSSG